ncbi:MAG: hypothetical protein KQ78_01014 [Candidatus Izimaplasma bacterium HR2]|nr:MAG: hypothetical protein KQ78_01014 [Candidatus Izimaplasma bacterium HR2]
MRIKNIPDKKQIRSNSLLINFLLSGDIYDITSKNNIINLFRGNLLDGSVANIYLKVFSEENSYTTPLIGVKSLSSFKILDNKAVYSGEFKGVNYQVTLILNESTWYYQISYKSDKDLAVQFYYGQDVGINQISSVLSSEPYTVQYIDYKVFEDESGYTLCARQNQGETQFLQIGSSINTIGYTTDGFQFFGKEYKYSNIPIAYSQERLSSEIYQYEFSYLALQTETLYSKQENQHFAFYGHYDGLYKDIIKKPKDIAIPNYYYLHQIENIEKRKGLIQTNIILNGKSVDGDYIKDKFIDIRHKEFEGNQLISFFCENHHHVVMQRKELIVERPHGHLMIHGDIERASENVMATTNFMFGVFNSHIVLGNTTFNKFLGDVRNPLNIQKISGQRIYIYIDGEYKILGLPSYYDMGATSTTWTYVLDDDILKISSFVDIKETTERLIFSSNKSYDIIISQQVVMGSEENLYDIEYTIEEGWYTFISSPNSMMNNEYPELKYKLKTTPLAQVLSEEDGLGFEAKSGLLLLSFKETNEIIIDIKASLNGKTSTKGNMDFADLDQKGTNFFESYLGNLVIDSEDQKISKIIDISFWYTHNALVHYSSPHGLEQYNGAAWGTRDVCQGPAELFIAAQRFDLVRNIILKVYKRQFLENGDFPQWFMSDKYFKIQAHEAHGDIIIWPLRLLAYYLSHTDDFSILNEKIPYMSLENNNYSNNETLMSHVHKQLQAINSTFIIDTHLPKYGGGDWDDTLQPANHKLKENMVSGWTVALLYETINVFSDQIIDYDLDLHKELTSMKNNIKLDYEKHIIKDNLPAGFVVFGETPKVLIHPRDKQTGIKYRLLPYLRSIISSIATPEQSEIYKNIIQNKLKHPDGVRLMDKTVTYNGGERTFFQRAETAANFGREVGLQYVHAHIRYIEAMYNIGCSDEAYKGFYEVNPITIQNVVKNAFHRQGNMYFSSSDANVKTRYEAQENFEKIKTGQINVKGGWRLYSSGPGIYIKQVISNLLGIEQLHNKLLIDPEGYNVAKLKKINYHFQGQKVVINIHKGKPKILVNDNVVEVDKIYNRYRFKGYLIDPIYFLDNDVIKIDLWINT